MSRLGLHLQDRYRQARMSAAQAFVKRHAIARRLVRAGETRSEGRALANAWVRGKLAAVRRAQLLLEEFWDLQKRASRRPPRIVRNLTASSSSEGLE